jgi:hypothetical protein
VKFKVAPVAVIDEIVPEESIGATESTVLYATEIAVLAELLFPAVSKNVFAPTDIEAFPEAFAVGVKIAVKDLLLTTTKFEIEPPVTVMSPTAKS